MVALPRKRHTPSPSETLLLMQRHGSRCKSPPKATGNPCPFGISAKRPKQGNRQSLTNLCHVFHTVFQEKVGVFISRQTKKVLTDGFLMDAFPNAYR